MAQFRVFLLRQHTWVGLIMAMYFGLMFITGSLLVFRGELINLITPQPQVEAPADAKPLTLGALHDKAMAAYPDATIYFINEPAKPGLGAQVDFRTPARGRIVAALHPYDGSVMAELPTGGIMQVVRDLHASLFIPKKVGFLLVSATSMILLFSVVSGLTSYRRFWRGFLRKPAADAPLRARWGGWHRLFGLWAAPFLLVVSLTGLYFFAKDLHLTGTAPPAPLTQARDDIRPTGFSGVQIDQGALAVAAANPDFSLRGISLPSWNRAAIAYKGAISPGGIMDAQTHFVDPTSLEVIKTNTSWDHTGLGKIGPWFVALHFGTWGGDVVRVLWVGWAALSMALLFAGVRIHLGRTAANAPTQLSGLRRYWQGMGIFRWGYVVLALGLIGLGIVRYAL